MYRTPPRTPWSMTWPSPPTATSTPPTPSAGAVYHVQAAGLGPDAPATATLPVLATLPGPHDTPTLNGIVVTPDQRALVVADFFTSRGLYRVDRRSGETRQIDLGSPHVVGDGLLMRGRTLYVVSSVDGNGDTVNVIRL